MADPHDDPVSTLIAAPIPTQVRPTPLLDPSQETFAGRAAAAGVDLTGPLTHGALVVDLARYVVTLEGRQLELSARQMDLLAVFLGAPHRVWSRAQLHEVCWGEREGGASRTVDMELSRLRSKVGIDLLRNVPHRGWILRAAAASRQ